MNTTAVSSRARTLAVLAATGGAALVGALAVAGSPASAAAASPRGAEVPRIALETQIWCYEGDLGSVTFYYDDLADGHVPQRVHEEVSDESGVVWTRDDLHQEFGNYFNLQVFSSPEGPRRSTGPPRCRTR